MTQETIAPSLKAFMNHALPQDKGEHVLALGEEHIQTAHYKWLGDHLDELKQEHNLGAIGLEFPPFMEVFLWAYKDGKLPVGEDPEKAKAYVERMLTTPFPSDFEENVSAQAELSMVALERNIPIVFFDSRRQRLPSEERFSSYIKSMSESFDNGNLSRKDLRENSDNALKKLGLYRKNAFMRLEVQQLLDDNPEYQARLDNIEAVMAAQQDWRAAKTSIPEHDTTSAAIMQATMPKEKNAITVSGMKHVLGLKDSAYRHEGTLSQHFDALGLKTSTAFMGDNVELEGYCLKGNGRQRFESHIKDSRHPYHLPTLLSTDTGEVVPPAQKIKAAPDANTAPLAAQVYKHKQDYNAENPDLADAPFPSKVNQQEVSTSQAALKTAHMQKPLKKLANNKPWAEMIADQAQEVQGKAREH